MQTMGEVLGRKTKEEKVLPAHHPYPPPHSSTQLHASPFEVPCVAEFSPAMGVETPAGGRTEHGLGP